MNIYRHKAMADIKLKREICYYDVIQWYLGIRPLWNKSNLIYFLFGCEKFCLVYVSRASE
jgi:hypothetical protein